MAPPSPWWGVFLCEQFKMTLDYVKWQKHHFWSITEYHCSAWSCYLATQFHCSPVGNPTMWDIRLFTINAKSRLPTYLNVAVFFNLSFDLGAKLLKCWEIDFVQSQDIRLCKKSKYVTIIGTNPVWKCAATGVCVLACGALECAATGPAALQMCG